MNENEAFSQGPNTFRLKSECFSREPEGDALRESSLEMISVHLKP